MNQIELQLTRDFLPGPSGTLGLEHLPANPDDPRFTTEEDGTVILNLDFFETNYGVSVRQDISAGDELYYQKRMIEWARAQIDSDKFTLKPPLFFENTRVNSQLVELDRFLFMSQGIDLIGLLNDKERAQQEINPKFELEHIYE